MSDQILRLNIQGMSCANCAGRVERTLQNMPDVTESNVNLVQATAQLRLGQQAPSPQDIINAITDAGYPASLAQPVSQPVDRTAEFNTSKQNLILAFCLAAPVVILEMGGHLFGGFHTWVMTTIGHYTSWAIQFVLTTLLLVGPGRKFFTIGLPNLFKASPDMNSLVAIGSLAAWGYSTCVLLGARFIPVQAQHVYFEAAAMIVALILLGRWLEDKAKSHATEAIEHLMARLPQIAMIERNGVIAELPIAEIKVGDIAHIAAGAQVPVDGIITSGTSEVDEAMLTGEPMPSTKTIGDAVTGGTINGTGSLIVQTTQVGEHTALAKIIAAVEQAQGTKLPIQTLADKVIRYFVPAILAIAALTVCAWLIWGPAPSASHALVAGVAVLIIACPCAMGLAVPMSVMVGTGRGAELGVLFRKGDALQTLKEVEVVAFDKTGTLTLGQPRIVDVHLAEGTKQQTALSIAAALEGTSQHPIAEAFREAAQDSTLPEASEVKAVPGLGIQGQVSGKPTLLGNAEFLENQGISIAALGEGTSFAEAGHTPVYLAYDGTCIAGFGLNDQLKPQAQDTIQALNRQGIQCVMITGDQPQAAEAMARILGISQVFSQVKPTEKADRIKELQANGQTVAFVGDGINDAPALATADVGIAIGGGTDVAIESADVVLMSGDISGVSNALQLSKAAFKNIRQNLGWAFGYNVVLIPVAAGAIYPFTGLLFSPVLGAAAMALSSLFVVGNALRLKSFSPRGLR